ncbi:hypothetical protein GCM10007385_06460 [Tateyamaria omphalii]|uniref:hypothetical protein n=1 Tax=Tateyamaria omphalii TaxID=299262 RepID=UPI00167C251F|nr:hypothetical protein [Tateyamaria omphalii]GGX41613.1 hypothetical protein GCM10007385_06460 [Tateyamaria omphalii]
MRLQYHFRPSPRGLLAWDMRKIAEASVGLLPQPVRLTEIAEVDENWWFAHNVTPTPRTIAHHMQLVKQANRAYPIILDAEGRLMDGMHRVVQALLAGDTTIQAIRLPVTPAPDFVGIDPDDLPYETTN